MAATMSATLSFPFQASMDMDGTSNAEGHDDLCGLDFNMYYEMPSSDLEDDEEEEGQSVATFNPRWDSLPSNQELSMMASQRLSTMALHRETADQTPLFLEPALVEDEDKEVVICESPPLLPEVQPRARLPIPPRPRFYSTPITDDDSSTTPVLLYGLEEPSEYAPPPRRRLPTFRPVSFMGGSAPSSRPSSSHRNQPPVSRPYQSPTPRERSSSTPLKRLSTLIENASHQVHSTVSSYVPKGTTIEESTVSGTSSASTSRSRVTLATIDSDGATAPSPTISGSPASSIRDALASADSPKAAIYPPPVPAAASTSTSMANLPPDSTPDMPPPLVPTVVRAATSIVTSPSENASAMLPPPPPPKPTRRKTAPDMNLSRESRPPTATKSRVPSGFSSIAKMSLPKLPSLGHRVRESEKRNESIKPTHEKSVVPNTASHTTLAQSLTRPLPPPPPPHDYGTQAFPMEIQPDYIPSHTNYDQRAATSTTRSFSSRPTGYQKPSNNYAHQEQSQSQSQRGREHVRHEQKTRAKSSGRMTRVFSQFVN